MNLGRLPCVGFLTLYWSKEGSKGGLRQMEESPGGLLAGVHGLQRKLWKFLLTPLQSSRCYSWALAEDVFSRDM